MKHTAHVLMATVLVVGPVGQLWAQQEQSGSYSGSGVPSSSTHSPAQPQPGGPEQMVPLPPSTTGLIGYKPIPESMLPKAIVPTIPTQGPPAPGPVATNLGGPTVAMGPYTLGKDDVVHIEVQGQPDFTGPFVIGPNGYIQYGFVGDVWAEGLTKEELAQVIADKLKRYVRIPTVNITIVGFNSKAIYILGRVAQPGKYAMRGDSVKIRDALIAAGLVTQHAALSRVVIVKSDLNDPTHRTVDLKRVLYKGITKDNIDLVNGDIVVVPSTVWGAVSDFITSLTSPASKAGTVAALAAL